YRLEVENTGSTAARDVEVFARAVFREQSIGTWVKDERFVPQWLEWSTLRSRDVRLGLFLPVIPPGSARYFDLTHVIEPHKRRWMVDSLEQDEDVDPQQAILSLDVA